MVMKRKTSSRLLATLLCVILALCCSGMAVPALAAGIDAKAGGEDVIGSGTWGKCAWEITEDESTDDVTLTVHPGLGEDTNGDNGGDSPWAGYSDSITAVVFMEEDGQKVILPEDCSMLFQGFEKARSMDLSGCDTSKVTSMSSMFHHCEGLTSLDLSGWDTSSVTNMNGMFFFCEGLTSLDLSGWDTSSVTDMGGMFCGCSSLSSLDLSGWDTSSVSKVHFMFSFCKNLTSLDLSSWDTSLVRIRKNMFDECGSLDRITIGKGYGFRSTQTASGDSIRDEVENMFPNATAPDGWYSVTDKKWYSKDEIISKHGSGGVADTYVNNVDDSNILPVTSKGCKATYDGSSHSITVDAGGSGADVYYATEELTADNFSTDGSKQNPAYKNAGTYDVYFYVDSSGYPPSPQAGKRTVRIKPAEITIAAADKESEYGQPTVDLAWQVTGDYVEGDELGVTAYTEATASSDAGEYPITLSISVEIKNYSATLKDGTYTIKKAKSTATAPKAKTDLVYNGEPQDLVTAGSTSDGTLQYSLTEDGTFEATLPVGTDAGTYAVYYMVKGDANHKDSDVMGPVSVTIAKAAGEPEPKPEPAPGKASIAKAKVTLAKASFTYDGKAKTPAVKSVVLGGKTLKAGRDYTVSYQKNKALGTATVVVAGKGGYKDKASATFTIVLAKVKKVTMAHPAASSMDVEWQRVAGAKRYLVEWRVKGGKWESATATGASKAVRGLKAGKLYQFRVRAVAGEHEGAWSKLSCRYFAKVASVSAKGKGSGAVKVKWAADAKANEGYAVYVRDARTDKLLAKATVGSGKTSATLTGLKPGKRVVASVRPIRSAGGKLYKGVKRTTAAFKVK